MSANALAYNCAKESGGNLDSLVAKNFATEVTLAALSNKIMACNTGAVVLAAGSASIGTVGLNAGTAAIGSVTVSNLPTTQPINGTVTANIGTVAGLALDASLTTLHTDLGQLHTDLVAATPTGTNSIGTVGLNAGSNIVGKFQLIGADGTTLATVANPSLDALSASTTKALIGMNLGYVYNGTTWDRERSDGTTGGQGVGGTVASATTDSGNPVKIGGKYNATLPTFTDGQRGDLQINSSGLLQVNATLGSQTATDGINGGTGFFNLGLTPVRVAGVGPYTFNGSSWDRARWDGTTGGRGVGGTVASATADSGNPVKVGGKYNATPPTFTDGQRGDLQLTAAGGLTVTLTNASGTVLANSATGDSSPFSGSNNLRVLNVNYLFNNATFDMLRGNFAATLLASAARTTTTTSADFINYNGRGVQVIVSVTVLTSGASLVPDILGKDSISGSYFKLMTSGNAIVATGVYVYEIYPGIGAVSGDVTARTNGIVPRTIQFKMTPADAKSVTYSVSIVSLL